MPGESLAKNKDFVDQLNPQLDKFADSILEIIPIVSQEIVILAPLSAAHLGYTGAFQGIVSAHEKLLAVYELLKDAKRPVAISNSATQETSASSAPPLPPQGISSDEALSHLSPSSIGRRRSGLKPQPKKHKQARRRERSEHSP